MAHPRAWYKNINLEFKSFPSVTVVQNTNSQITANLVSASQYLQESPTDNVGEKSLPVNQENEVLLYPLVNMILGYWGSEENPTYEKKGGSLSINGICNEIATVLRPRLQEALMHIVSGEQKKANDILLRNPELLLMSGTVRDKIGNTFEDVTPMTLSYLLCDSDMFSSMFPLLKELDDGEQEMLRQIEERCAESKEIKPYDFTELVLAITERKGVATALNLFRQNFKPGNINYHNHIQNLIKAYEVNAMHQKSWNMDQSMQFGRYVIGHMQRQLPVCLIQALFQGIGVMVKSENVQPLRRVSCGFKEFSDDMGDPYVGGSFFPQNLSFQYGLGIDYAVNLHGQSTRTFYMTINNEAATLQKYVEFKRNELHKLVDQCKKSPRLTR